MTKYVLELGIVERMRSAGGWEWLYVAGLQVEVFHQGFYNSKGLGLWFEASDQSLPLCPNGNVTSK